MDTEGFVNLSLDDLARLTNIDKSRWSRYLNGANLSKETFSRAASQLYMAPEKLLEAINIRRQQKTNS